jgi:hypothetical protein
MKVDSLDYLVEFDTMMEYSTRMASKQVGGVQLNIVRAVFGFTLYPVVTMILIVAQILILVFLFVASRIN